MAITTVVDGKLIGRRVADLRARARMTQQELADEATRTGRAHVGRSWLSLLEAGFIDVPGLQRVAALSEALRVDLDELIRGAGDVADVAGAVELSDDEEALLALYRSMPFSGRGALLEIVQATVRGWSRLPPPPGGPGGEQDGSDAPAG